MSNWSRDKCTCCSKSHGTNTVPLFFSLNALAKTVTFEQTKKNINVESALSSWIERRRDKKKEKSHTHTDKHRSGDQCRRTEEVFPREEMGSHACGNRNEMQLKKKKEGCNTSRLSFFFFCSCCLHQHKHASHLVVEGEKKSL